MTRFTKLLLAAAAVATAAGFATPGEAHDWRGAFDPTESEWQRVFPGSGRWRHRGLVVPLITHHLHDAVRLA